MPRILENEAFALAQGIDSLDEAQRPQALDVLTRYKQQQDDNGEPHWPSQVQERQTAQDRVRGMFTGGIDKVPFEVSAWSKDPAQDKAIVANQAFLAHRYGKTPQEIADRPDFYRDDYARQYFEQPGGVDEKTFYGLATKQIQGEQQKEGATRDGINAALRGDDAIPSLQAWQQKNGMERMPDSTQFTSGFLQARSMAGGQLEFAGELLKQIESNIGMTKGDGAERQAPASREMASQFEASLATLAEMKPRDRKQVYAIIGAKAEAAGYDQKGFWTQMLSYAGKQMARAGDTTTTAFSDLAASGAAAEGAAFDPGAMGRFQQGMDTRGKRGVIFDELADIASGEIDPVKPVLSWMNDSLEKGLIQGPGAIAPFMMTSAALGPIGGGLMFTADFAEQNRRDLVRSGMDDSDARLIGMAAAPIQAAVESLSNGLQLGRFPAVQRALAGLTKPISGGAGMLTRYGLNYPIALGSEFTEEQLQDNVIRPAVQNVVAAFDEDVPEIGIGQIWENIKASSPELLFTLAPMALVFGGTMTAAQANLSSSLVSSQDMLEAAGYSAAQANAVRAESSPDAQISKAREMWGSRAGTPASMETAAKSVAERMRMLQTDHMAAQQDLERRGIVPIINRIDEEGRRRLFFSDGSTADFNSYAEASAARWQWTNDQLGKVHLATREALQQLEKDAAVGRAYAVQFKPDALTAQQVVDQGRVSADQMQRRVQQGEATGESSADPNEAEIYDNAIATGKAMNSEDLASQFILGSSVNTFKDNVLTTTIRLYEGANVLTLVEEKLEGDAKQIVASVPGRAWMLQSLRGYEQASGDKLFRTADDTALQDDDLIEAWSSLGQSYLVGKSKKGAAIGKGGARRIFSDALRAGMGGAMNAETQFFGAVWRRAAKLSKLKRAGKLDEDLTSELERQLGIDSQAKFEQGVQQDAQSIGTEALSSQPIYSEENPGPNGETFSIRSVSPAQDAEYMAAVESGDVAKQQALVNAAAKAAGYTVGPVYHGVGETKFNVFKTKSGAHYFTPLKALADAYSEMRGGSGSLGVYLKIKNPFRGFSSHLTESRVNELKAQGYDGAIGIIDQSDNLEETVVFNSNQIKSADPITRDAEGNVIPLSQRFDPADNRITYSLRKFTLPSLSAAADTLRGMKKTGKTFDFPAVYAAAASGQSSRMLPLDSLYEQAKKQVPTLTTAEFGKQVKALYDTGALYLEPGDTPASMTAALEKYGLRDSLGIPSMYAGPVDMGETFSVQPSPGGLSEANGFKVKLSKEDYAALRSQLQPGERLAWHGSSRLIKGALKVGTGENPSSNGVVSLSSSRAVAHSYGENVGAYAVKMKRPFVVDYDNRTYDEEELMEVVGYDMASNVPFGDWLKSEGYDGVVVKNIKDHAEILGINLPRKWKDDLPAATLYLIPTSKQLRALYREIRPREIHAEDVASAVNPESSRAAGGTFSLRSGDFASRMAAAFSPFQRSPELRMAIAQVAKARAQKLGAEWVEKGAVIRSTASIAQEARMREALAYEARMNEYLDGLTEAARQDLEFEPADLKSDPLVSAMLDYGKLMSRSTAMQSGKLGDKSGDYDGVPWLPASFYSKGSGIMPDQMAQAMNDAGLLPDAYTDTLWQALASRIESSRKDKARAREAAKAYKDAQKYARNASSAEADKWAEGATKQSGSPKAQREMLKAALRTLDGILSAAPPEVRAKVGGYVKLAGLATDEAMLKEIERRIEKLNVELEKWIKKEGVEQLQKLLKKGRPTMDSGKKGKGKDPDMHALFAAAEKASKMDEVAVSGELARLDSLIAGDTLTDEQETLAITQRGLVELLGDLKNADSGRVFSALDTLKSIYDGAWLKWKLAEIERKERRAGTRQDFITDTGKSGVLPERQAAEKQVITLLGKIKGGFLSLSSFHEVLSYAFGSKSARVKSLVDAEREAAGQYEDVNQALADEVEALFTDMAGGTLDGERLRFDMAQPSIKTGKGEFSQLQAIQALLMWRQEDGRRHMEGTFDESGKPSGAWNYDQAWIDEITAAQTPEARRLMSWIMQKYGAEWGALNTLYRERYGVNMPAHDNYAPITVTPMQSKTGEVVDPVTGTAMSSGSILTPGSLRTRSRNAIAEPEFRDALQTLLVHTRQLEYWKAYYDLAVEANAILGNREVLNAVKAKGGEQAATALRKWVDAIAQGGFRDASASLEINKMLQRMTGRAASVGLLGRFSTLLVQSTQLAAASVKVPLGAYLRGISKLLTGNLQYGDAIKSDFIQRRFKSAPPIVRQAMESLGAASRPNQITRAARGLGQLLSGADALFTAGTYALLLDYHRGTGNALGLSGAELELHAHTEAQRDTEQVAQPMRMATRSLEEITSTNPLAKVSWAYASEARQKIALAAWSATEAASNPAQFAKTMFLVFGVGGLMTQLLKNLWKEVKGDDDEKKWSPERMVMAALAGPLHGIPLASELSGDSGMLSGAVWAWPALKDIVSGEGDMRDVDTLLSTMGYFNDTAAGVASLSHAGLDFAKVLKNLSE